MRAILYSQRQNQRGYDDHQLKSASQDFVSFIDSDVCHGYRLSDNGRQSSSWAIHNWQRQSRMTKELNTFTKNISVSFARTKDHILRRHRSRTGGVTVRLYTPDFSPLSTIFFVVTARHSWAVQVPRCGARNRFCVVRQNRRCLVQWLRWLPFPATDVIVISR